MSLKKKLKKAAKVAGAAYLASKAMSGAGAGVNVDKGRGSALSNMYRKSYTDGIMRGGKGTKAASIGIMDKIGNAASKVLNMGPGKNATSKKGGTLAKKILSGSTFGLDDMGGAKHGGMMQKKMGGGMIKNQTTGPVLMPYDRKNQTTGPVLKPQDKMGGGMMYATKGTYVKASCKLGKNKKTLIT